MSPCEPMLPLDLPEITAVGVAPPSDLEAALEAALLAGTERSSARSSAVQVFLAMSAGLILERMQAAGLSVVRAQDVAHG